VTCWGDDGFGELGNGKLVPHSLVPVAATELGAVRQIALGAYDTCAINLDGSVSCLGYERGFDLPSHVHDATSIAAGGDGLDCAVYAGGLVACWGDAGTGAQYGDGSVTPGAARFAIVQGIGNAQAVAVGGDFACALLSDGSVSCWGAGPVVLGPGAVLSSCMGAPCVPTPSPVRGLTDVMGISAGLEHVCALRVGGTIVCWGANDDGALGDGTMTASSTPVFVRGIADAVAVSAGWRYTCALSAAGNVSCWGRNLFGQLGNGKTSDSLFPVTVSF
jgi:alpha-tubulin suppressor-like RCC1 family protein